MPPARLPLPPRRLRQDKNRDVTAWFADEFLSAAVGEYLADQLVLPMALAGAGEFTVAHPSCHLLTNIAVVERFLPVRFGLIETDGVTRVSIE